MTTTPTRARTALDYACASVRTVAPARWLASSALLAPTPGEPEAKYRDSVNTNVLKTLHRLRKQLRIQEQTEGAAAA